MFVGLFLLLAESAVHAVAAAVVASQGLYWG